MTAKVDREDPAWRPGVTMDRTGAAQTQTFAGRGREVQQLQHLLDCDLATHLLWRSDKLTRFCSG